MDIATGSSLRSGCGAGELQNRPPTQGNSNISSHLNRHSQQDPEWLCLLGQRQEPLKVAEMSDKQGYARDADDDRQQAKRQVAA